MSTSAATADTTTGTGRWTQLGLGLVCMMAISSPQYVWTLFVKPLSGALGVGAPALQVTFSIMIILQTFFSPFQGWLVDRFGPRKLIGLGGVLTGLSWVLASQTTSLTQLYLTYGVIAGLGTGIVYVGVVGQVVGWFPDRRGFAAGVVTAGYGMGAILTTFPITNALASVGYQTTLIRFGIVFGVVGLVAALGLKPPPAATVEDASAGAETGAMLKSPVFWLMFVMMTMMSTSGLMVVSNMAGFATEFGVAQMVVSGMAALPLALTIDRFTNGLTRPFFGWVSDQLGRENTMFLAFTLEGIAMAVWLAMRSDPLAFALLSGLVFFGWGEIFSLFPSTLTDTFGTKHATRNYGCLYIAQGIGSFLGGPMAALLHGVSGSWATVFYVAIAADLITAVLAIAVLKPLRAAYR
ncbi:MAG TPA: oxalate/formate MFS antiporter [Acetobacteraceae bacterium]|jgi:OFA family oxalate/formate antiporter-like MFS transporter|nr:oxalate/formate MFS antiporter [Acetobacteraceae bacterium]HTC09411.1 oxalate/formate MFS antiporter [Acetobacteraceae bacterium]